MQTWLWDTLLLGQAGEGWADTFSGLSPDNKFALLVVAIGCATGVICTIVVSVSGTFNSIHRRRVEAELKRDMMDRGMSAEDITKITESATPPEDATQRWIASWANKRKSV